ncbi:CYTH and CHAD domain-containing protein [Ottowia caeni]|uniref:CYTH and CHAD domain-containing protein n=1 Tax=Ottowia caeni TaxID=2870339 RepID=UPI001E6429BC|nr:CHAD domain-containing protein [Ottowia caeni]
MTYNKEAHAKDKAPAEIELKLALPWADHRLISAQVSEIPPLNGIVSEQQHLRNIYFDTPEQYLRQQRAALRLRSVRQGKKRTHWRQTFKTAGSGASGLSQRGEWESTVSRGELDPNALEGTPWHAIEGHEQLFTQLTPCFETISTRTLWQVSAGDDGLIEVALDVGSVQAGGRTLPICELELELVHGPVDSLFVLAGQIAAHVAVLPTETSKAERGWRLLDDSSATALRARPPDLDPHLPAERAAQTVLGEMLSQFTENLARFVQFDDAELVHQARVGWRRWNSGLWLFKPLLKDIPVPDTTGLAPLRRALGRLRDLDVAALETLPPWKEPFISGNADREAQWHSLEKTLTAERQVLRSALCEILSTPETGAALLGIGRWLHALPQYETKSEDIGPWAEKRTGRLHTRLKNEIKVTKEAKDRGDEDALEQEHRTRLLAKRSRYCLEAMQSLLPNARTRRWIEKATEVQTQIGAARDLMLITFMLEPLGADRAILGFLRGVAAARMA